MADADHTARVQVIETKLEHFAIAINDLTKAVREISARPQQIAWREVATTAAVILALFAYAGNFLEGQFNKNVANDRYRIDQLERKFCVVNAVFCTK